MVISLVAALGLVSALPALAEERSELGPPVMIQAAGKPIDVEIGHAAPCVGDFDGDGVRDLLVGQFGDGKLRIYRNVGSTTEPELAGANTLVPESKSVPGHIGAAREKTGCGMRAKICVTDWNGDGLPDLLVGDFAMEPADKSSLSDEEKAAEAQLRKQLQELIKELQELQKPPADETPEARKEREQKLQSIMAKYREASQKLRPEYEYHGRVWFFPRKPAEKAAVQP